MAMRSPVSAIDPNGRGGDEGGDEVGDEGGREEGRQQAASPLRLSESSVARLVLAADGAERNRRLGEGRGRCGRWEWVAGAPRHPRQWR